MTRFTHELHVDDAGLADLRRPRDDFVLETPVGDDTFTLTDGPFDHYERRLEVTPADGGWRVTESFDYRTATSVWRPLFALPVRRALRHPPAPRHQPWWAPPVRLDHRAASVLALVAVFQVLDGYLGTVITQTATFATDEFGRSDRAQGTLLAAVRLGVPLALVFMALADRFGRRRAVLWASTWAVGFTALGAVSPDLWFLGVTQAVARGITIGLGLGLTIIAAEELPAGARAWGLSVLALVAALGSGMAVWVLPVADLGERGWRIVYLVPIAFLPVVAWARGRLPETRRFEVADTAAEPRRLPRRRLLLLGVAAFCYLAFAAPASQFQNDFLKDERDFSATAISLFTVVTSTPAGIGVFVGGLVADRHGRRPIAVVGLVGGALLVVASYGATGSSLWVLTAAAVIIGGVTVPALGVYGPELFGTRTRGRANGWLTVFGVAGSATGLLLIGWLHDSGWSYQRAFTWMLLTPVLVALLVVLLFPETHQAELEDLNPEDRPAP